MLSFCWLLLTVLFGSFCHISCCKLSLSSMIHYWYPYLVETYICHEISFPQPLGSPRLDGLKACENRLKGQCQWGWQWHGTFYPSPRCIDSLSWYWWEWWWWRTPSILYSLILKVINLEKPHHADSAQHRCQINQSGRIRPTKELFVMDLRRSESPITDHHGHQHHHLDWPQDGQKNCVWCKCFYTGVVDVMSHMSLL